MRACALREWAARHGVLTPAGLPKWAVAAGSTIDDGSCRRRCRRPWTRARLQRSARTWRPRTRIGADPVAVFARAALRSRKPTDRDGGREKHRTSRQKGLWWVPAHEQAGVVPSSSGAGRAARREPVVARVDMGVLGWGLVGGLKCRARVPISPNHQAWAAMIRRIGGSPLMVCVHGGQPFRRSAATKCTTRNRCCGDRGRKGAGQ